MHSTPTKENHTMSIVVRFSPKSLTAKKYDEIIRTLEERGMWPAEGVDYHVCFGADGNLLVSEIWDSQEAFAAFGEKLMPVLDEAGIEFSAEPQVFEVHTTYKR
jgi:hypothetical protein